MSITYVKNSTISQFGSEYIVQSVYKLTEKFMSEAGLVHPNRVTLRKVKGVNGGEILDSAISWEHPEPTYFSTPGIERALAVAYATDGLLLPEAHNAAIAERNRLSEELAAELGLTIQQFNRQRLGIKER
jgi:hypothetical protein